MQEYKYLAEYAVSLAERLGFEYSEAFFENSFYSSYAIEQGALNGTGYAENLGMRLRLIRNGRLYTFSTDELSKRKIRDAISGFKGFVGIDTALSQESIVKAKYEVKVKKKIDKARLLEDLFHLDKVLAERKHIRYRSLYSGFGRWDTFFVNSDGTEIEAKTHGIGAFFNMVVGRGRETRQRLIQIGGTGGYELFDIDRIERQAVEESKAMLNVIEHGVTLSSAELRGIRNVVLSPEIIGIAVHESVGHPCEADRVFLREAAQAGTGYVTEENLGLEIGSDRVTIIDDPTIPNSHGFYLYDHEGVKARPKVIVERGVQKELLTNREFAHVLGTRSNGSARADSYANEPLVRMSNTYLKNGSASFEELVSEARNGVYIKNFTEWNIDDTRSFSRYQGNEAYLIRNSRLGKPIKNYVIEKKTLDLWHAVRLVGRDSKLYVGSCGKGEPHQGVPVMMGGPSALLSFK